MVDKANALPGRPQKMQVSDRHYVLGNKMEGPWPEGHKVFVFANGCFWGSEKGIWRLPGDGIYTTGSATVRDGAGNVKYIPGRK